MDRPCRQYVKRASSIPRLGRKGRTGQIHELSESAVPARSQPLKAKRAGETAYSTSRTAADVTKGGKPSELVAPQFGRRQQQTKRIERASARAAGATATLHAMPSRGGVKREAIRAIGTMESPLDPTAVRTSDSKASVSSPCAREPPKRRQGLVKSRSTLRDDASATQRPVRGASVDTRVSTRHGARPGRPATIDSLSTGRTGSPLQLASERRQQRDRLEAAEAELTQLRAQLSKAETRRKAAEARSKTALLLARPTGTSFASVSSNQASDHPERRPSNTPSPAHSNVRTAAGNEAADTSELAKMENDAERDLQRAGSHRTKAEEASAVVKAAPRGRLRRAVSEGDAARIDVPARPRPTLKDVEGVSAGSTAFSPMHKQPPVPLSFATSPMQGMLAPRQVDSAKASSRYAPDASMSSAAASCLPLPPSPPSSPERPATHRRAASTSSTNPHIDHSSTQAGADPAVASSSALSRAHSAGSSQDANEGLLFGRQQLTEHAGPQSTSMPTAIERFSALHSAPSHVVDVVQASAALRAALALGEPAHGNLLVHDEASTTTTRPSADIDSLALEAVLLSAADSDRHGSGGGFAVRSGETQRLPSSLPHPASIPGEKMDGEEQTEGDWQERFGILATAAKALQAAVAQAKTEAVGDADFAAAELEARAEEDQAAARVAEAMLAQSMATCRAAEDSALEAAEEAAAASLRAERAEHAQTTLSAELERERGRVMAAEAQARGAEAETLSLAGQLDELVSCLDELCESLVAGAVEESGTQEHSSPKSDTDDDIQAVVEGLLAKRVPKIADLIRNGVLATAREAGNKEELNAALASVRTAAALGTSLSLGGD